jgi:hypothetical protein
VLALYFGLVETMLIGAGLYLVALAIAASLPRLRSAPAATLAEARHVV